MYLHLGFNHDIYELVLALGYLDNLFNQTCANPALQVRDSAHVSFGSWKHQRA